MPFFKSCMGKGKNCMGKGKKRAAKLRAKLLQKELDGSPAISLRLLLIDKQVDAQGVIPGAALKTVHCIKYDSALDDTATLVKKIREAHTQNGGPFLSIAIAQHGPNDENEWTWTKDLMVDLDDMNDSLSALAPIIEPLAACLRKTAMGKAHIDFLACRLAESCKGLVPALEKKYGIDFRASTDDTGNALSDGDWKMETDNDYDVSKDYLDAAKIKVYTEKMGLQSAKPKGWKSDYKAAGDASTGGHRKKWLADVKKGTRKVEGVDFAISDIKHGGNGQELPENWGMTFKQFKDFLKNCRKSPQWEKLKNKEGRDTYSMTYPVAAKRGKNLPAKGYVSAGDVVYTFAQQVCAGSGCGLAGVLNPKKPLKTHMMLSHSWAEDIEEVENALERYFAIKLKPGDENRVVIWFCCFALAQPASNDESMPTVTLQCKMEPPPFAAAIKSASNSHGLVAVHTASNIVSKEHPDYDGPDNMYNRLWCVYELWYAKNVVGARCFLCVSDNYLYYLVNNFNNQQRFKVETEKANCSNAEDEKFIKSKIKKADFKTMDTQATTIRSNLAVICNYLPAGVKAKDLTILQIRKAEDAWRGALNKKGKTAIEAPMGPCTYKPN